MKRMALVFLFFALIAAGAQAQRNVRDSLVVIAAIGAQGGFHLPGGDLAKRFGTAGQIGGAFFYKFKNNWALQFDGTFFFGGTVREDSIFKNFTTRNDFIIDRTGNPADIRALERGYTFMISAGKIFPIIGPNPNSGINASFGVGFMEHKILVQDELGTVPQLGEDYVKGYDRLSNGLALRQAIGYQHFSNYRLMNYYIGFEFTQGFTKSRRSLNYDTMKRDTSQRVDLMFSLIARWYFPMYKRQPKDFYFY